MATNPEFSHDGAQIVGHLRLSTPGGSRLDTVTDIVVKVTLAHPVGPCIKAYNFITDAEVTNEILYNRRYSLMFEGGHRWIDTRRLGRIMDLPLDKTDHRRNLRYPIPQGECDARPGEAACTINSVD